MNTEGRQVSFEFACDGPVFKGVPVVDGHEILSATSIDVHLDASDFPQVTLALLPVDALKLSFSKAAVRLDDGTREALISLGWTPPAGEARPREFSNRFTVFPDSGVTELNCFRCPGPAKDTWRVGYHPSLDVLIEQARAHDLAKHAVKDEATP